MITDDFLSMKMVSLEKSITITTWDKHRLAKYKTNILVKYLQKNHTFQFPCNCLEYLAITSYNFTLLLCHAIGMLQNQWIFTLITKIFLNETASLGKITEMYLSKKIQQRQSSILNN